MRLRKRESQLKDKTNRTKDWKKTRKVKRSISKIKNDWPKE
jgi:hypothetical protein